MNDSRPWLKVFLGVVALGALGVSGWLVYRMYFAPGAEKLLAEAETAYKQGAETQDAASAAVRFHEAQLHASKALEQFEIERKEGKIAQDQAEKFTQQLGQAYWIKARALRDHAFAKAKADGKPIAEMDDSSTGERFKNVLAIPTDEARMEARDALRAAAQLLPGNAEVQKEALRMEIQMEPIAWNLVERLADNLVNKLKQKDLRAYFMMARHEFEQPQLQEERTTRQKGFVPTPPESRTRERILKARGYLNTLKEMESTPYWRTVALEAQIRVWLRNDEGEGRRKDRNAYQKEDRDLRQFLFDETGGALARAAKDPQLEKLNFVDGRGVLAVHVLAVDFILEDLRKPKAEDRPPVSKLGDVFAALMTVCKRLTLADKINTAWLGEVGEQAAASTRRCQSMLASSLTEQWQEQVKVLKDLAQRCVKEKAGRPMLYYSAAEVFWLDAQRVARRTVGPKHEELRNDALKLAEDGLAVANERKPPLPAEFLADLNLLIAELKMVTGKSRVDVAGHIDALRKANTDRTLAMAEFLNGVLYLGEGRLEKARTALLQALKHASAPKPTQREEIYHRLQLALGEVHLALGLPAQAIDNFNYLLSAYAALERRPEAERLWHLDVIHSPDDVTQKLIGANLLAATLEVRKHQMEKPGQPIPPQISLAFEQPAMQLLQKLTPGTRAHREARLKLVNYLGLTGQQKRAQEELSTLTQIYPDSLDVARLDIALKLRPQADAPSTTRLDPKVVVDVDARIQRVREARKQDLSSRLFFAEWLVRSDRSEKAVEFLQASFPAAEKTDDRYGRVLALAQMARGNRSEGMKVIEGLPRDNPLDALNIVTAGSAEEKHKLLESAIANYQRKGTYQVWDAWVHVQQQNHKEAAEGFLKAMEYTDVRPMARNGLARALFAWAETKPTEAMRFVKQHQMIHPTEHVLLLAEAYAHYQLDDLGDPRDSKLQTVGMAGALERWELLIDNEIKDPSKLTDPQIGPLTRAEFWILAGQLDLAAAQAHRATRGNVRHEGALSLGVRIALESQDPILLADGRKYLTVLKVLRPDAPGVLLMEAQLTERESNIIEARRLYAELVEKHPTSSPAYRRFVALLEELGDKEQVARRVAEWRTHNPDDPGAVEALVRHLAGDKKLAEARKAADEFLTDSAKRAQERADALKQRPDQDLKSLEAQKQALMAHARADAQFRMAAAFMSAEAWDDADARLQEILKARPELEIAQLLRADILVGRKAWAEAKTAYEKLHKESQTVSQIAGNNLAWLLAKHLNQPAEAWRIADDLRKGRFSQKVLPGNRLRPEFLDTLGVVYRSQNRPELLTEMRDLFEKARRRYPTDPRVYLYLGHAYAGLNEVSAAQGMFTTAIELTNSKGKTNLSASRRKEVQDEAQTARQKLGAPSARP